jgi:GntR family transcriptional regulator
MTHAKERISAELPTDLAAEYLMIERSMPVLDIFRVAYTFGDKPVEVRQAQYITRDYHYLNHLN